MCSKNDESFDKYVLPGKPISPDASAATMLTFIDGVLLYNGAPVAAISLVDALNQFIKYLGKCVKDTDKCLLLAHNCHQFDSKVLLNKLGQCDLLENFDNVCIGFSDSLPLFQSLEPERKINKKGYKLIDLCHDLCSYDYDAHNSLQDVIALKVLCSKCASSKDLVSHSVSLKYVQETLLYHDNKQHLLSSFQPLICSKILSKGMADKLAGSGLQLGHLKLAHKRSPSNGIKALFSEKTIHGKPRITKNLPIIDKVINYLSSK